MPGVCRLWRVALALGLVTFLSLLGAEKAILAIALGLLRYAVAIQVPYHDD